MVNLMPLFFLFDGQNDVEATKAATVMNSAKADSTTTAGPVTAQLEDTEFKRVQDKYKRLQAEMSKMAEENRQLKVGCVDK